MYLNGNLLSLCQSAQKPRRAACCLILTRAALQAVTVQIHADLRAVLQKLRKNLALNAVKVGKAVNIDRSLIAALLERLKEP